MSYGLPVVWQAAAALLGWGEAILVGNSGHFQSLYVKALKLPPPQVKSGSTPLVVSAKRQQ